jgi:hypothetical protein
MSELSFLVKAPIRFPKRSDDCWRQYPLKKWKQFLTTRWNVRGGTIANDGRY